MGDVEGAVWRPLRALNDNQAHGREGSAVQPGEQEVRDAGVRPGSPLYRAPVWWLLDKGALVLDRKANEGLWNAAGAQHRDFAFKITGRGLDMLRGEGRLSREPSPGGRPALVMCGTMLVASLYLEQGVRNDEQ